MAAIALAFFVWAKLYVKLRKPETNKIDLLALVTASAIAIVFWFIELQVLSFIAERLFG